LHTDDTPTPPLRDMMFHLLHVEYVHQPARGAYAEDLADNHAVYVFVGGTGSLYVNDEVCEAAQDLVYMLPPRTNIRIDAGMNDPIQLYKISFAVYRINNKLPERHMSALIRERQPLKAHPFARVQRLAQQLHEDKLDGSDRAWMKQNLLFQELIAFLLAHKPDGDLMPTAAQAVEKTLQYLDNHYMETITVKRLTDLAGIPHWQYTAIFKELTGKRPLDYLNELRINRSKEKLAASDAPLREIAQGVGFADEYYFNRKFRRTTGLTPRQYALSMRRSVRVKDWTGHEVHIPAKPSRVIYYGEVIGDLLTLGIRPVGGSVMSPGQSFLDEPVRRIHDVGHPINTAKVSALKPDLIIFSNADEQRYEKIARIAPTVTYNSWGTLEERLSMLGEWFGKEKEAEFWLRRYKRNEENMWLRLRTVMRPGETASVFVYHRGKRLFVISNIGLSAFLYHPSGFQPPERVRAMLQAGQSYKEIPAKAISEYAGDRIFIVMPDNPLSQQATYDLLSSPLWRELPAYRAGCHYTVEEGKWNTGDAYSQEKLLAMLPELLTGEFV